MCFLSQNKVDFLSFVPGSWYLEVSQQDGVFESSQHGISSPGQNEDKEQDPILEKKKCQLIAHTLNILLKLSRPKCVL